MHRSSSYAGYGRAALPFANASKDKEGNPAALFRDINQKWQPRRIGAIGLS